MFGKKIPQRFLAALLLTTAGSTVAFSADSVQITNAWVRGTVSGQRGTGAYMDIVSDTPGRILSAASPVAANVEIHNMRMENGVMRMSPVKDIALEPGKTFRLAPGSYHVMMMGLKEPLKKGATVPIMLTVEGADKKIRQIEVKAEVRDLAGSAHH
jgi:copper(I)-binding protein